MTVDEGDVIVELEWSFTPHIFYTDLICLYKNRTMMPFLPSFDIEEKRYMILYCWEQMRPQKGFISTFGN
jgi:hypothetical protein